MKQRAWLDFWEKCAAEKENPIEAVQYIKGDTPLTDEEYQTVIKLVEDYLFISPSDKVLEIGCGCGLILNQLASRARAVVGIDYSQNMIMKAQELFPAYSFLVGEAANIPFPSHHFNRTFCFSIFAYFEDLAYAERSIKEFIRVTAPGGRVLLGDLIQPVNTKGRSLSRRVISSVLNYRYFLSRLLGKPPPQVTLTIEPAFVEEVLNNQQVKDFKVVKRENPPYALIETRYDVVIQL